MLGVGFPDRHALPRITPMKCTDRELRSPPARAGSFLGATRSARRRSAKDRFPPFPDIRDAGGEDPVRPGLFPKRGLRDSASACVESGFHERLQKTLLLLNISFAEPHSVASPLIIVTQGVEPAIVNCIV